ncbi:MAG: tetratricopeptide repeat protein [Rhizobium sp.]|nr:tetratricopeptide repeat protein [Rhizobium sp.]MBX9459181.1 tetratricopeptide repeat protein [Rhizobium sp.]
MIGAMRRESVSRPFVTTVAIVGIALLAACSSNKRGDVTGSIPDTNRPLEQMTQTELAAVSRSVGDRYAKNPKDRNAGLQYATLLRMTGKNGQALAVMRQIAILNPSDREVLAAYGKAQASAGELEQALGTISRAQTPDRPDWKLKSAEGAILDQLGRAEQARAAYRDALDIKPNEPSVLSNLGMSYLLTRDLKTSETYLRSAIAQPGADSRVRQNLALVVGLQGRFQEAENIARQELTSEQAEANMAYLKVMLAQDSNWQKLAAKDDGNTN